MCLFNEHKTQTQAKSKRHDAYVDRPKQEKKRIPQDLKEQLSADQTTFKTLVFFKLTIKKKKQMNKENDNNNSTNAVFVYIIVSENYHCSLEYSFITHNTSISRLTTISQLSNFYTRVENNWTFAAALCFVCAMKISI